MDEDTIYGEVSMLGFLRLINRACTLCQRKERGVFYDLGCGIGKTTILSAVRSPRFFQRCVGIELLPGLCRAAQSMTRRFNKVMKQADMSEDDQTPIVEIRQGDLFLCDLENASFIYFASTCFGADRMEQFREKATVTCADGCVIGTMTRLKLTSPSTDTDCHIELAEQHDVAMSWGTSIVYLYVVRRKSMT